MYTIKERFSELLNCKFWNHAKNRNAARKKMVKNNVT